MPTLTLEDIDLEKEKAMRCECFGVCVGCQEPCEFWRERSETNNEALKFDEEDTP